MNAEPQILTPEPTFEKTRDLPAQPTPSGENIADNIHPGNSGRESDRCGLKKRRWVAPVLLLSAVAASGASLAMWKAGAIEEANALAASQPEPVETITAAIATEREHRHTSTSIGTVVAMRSITLRNEVAGTVRQVLLTPGQIVEAGALLVALDVSVEEAELKALKAQAALARTLSDRMGHAVQSRAIAQVELDKARAELDVARAQIARTEAIIARKSIRAPFRAQVGISNVHPGQYLEGGSLLTTLQGVDEATHVDFSVPHQAAEWLKKGDEVEVIAGPDQETVQAEIVALDALVDPITRTTNVRARVASARDVPQPGASVRVRVPAGERMTAVSVPISAVRKGPAGDHVFVIAPDDAGNPRAHMKRVRTGATLGEEVLLISGVEAGERVAAHGSFKLQDGTKVAAAPLPSAPVASSAN